LCRIGMPALIRRSSLPIYRRSSSQITNGQ
jgi:hypothetical protein